MSLLDLQQECQRWFATFSFTALKRHCPYFLTVPEVSLSSLLEERSTFYLNIKKRKHMTLNDNSIVGGIVTDLPFETCQQSSSCWVFFSHSFSYWWWKVGCDDYGIWGNDELPCRWPRLFLSVCFSVLSPKSNWFNWNWAGGFSDLFWKIQKIRGIQKQIWNTINIWPFTLTILEAITAMNGPTEITLAWMTFLVLSSMKL